VCRHLGYLGPPVALSALLYDPSHSLVRQSWAPRQQTHGTVNADGYGVGWYQPSVRAEPARYRRAGPIWADPSLRSMAGVIVAGAVIAAVRSATPPAPVEETGAAPFVAERWLFSMNGAVAGGPAQVALLRRRVSDRRSAAIEGSSDSEVVFALILDALDAGCAPSAALAGVVRSVPGRLNLMLADGEQLWATAWGDSLSVVCRDGGVVVASEPFDDELDWQAVPDRSLVVAAGGACRITPMEAAG
jgi:gamma-glutamyl hercynylcysteine S-oxide hydrolase